MFIKNNQTKDIVLTSFEGYEFEVPVGVSWIWDKAGEHLLKTYEPKGEHGHWGYRPGIGQTDMGRGKVFILQEPPVPAITQATKEEWDNSGKRFCQVRRYKIIASMIPRENLIKIASQRGVSQQKLMEYTNDKNIELDVIAGEINNLPVPEEIKYPNLNE